MPYSEIEQKFNGDHVNIDEFLMWVTKQPEVIRYERVVGDDVYWEQGDSVIRHRHKVGPSSELTVKKRRAITNITNRMEINLQFSPKTKIPDVETFLEQTGWKKSVTLTKDAHIFWLQNETERVTIVLYDVFPPNKAVEPTKRFLEVEIESDSGLSDKAARAALRNWVGRLDERFDLGNPLNESLWEIYSGKQYLHEVK